MQHQYYTKNVENNNVECWKKQRVFASKRLCANEKRTDEAKNGLLLEMYRQFIRSQLIV